jgi:hypothetical protein
MSSNLVTTVTLPDIIMLIRQIPLRSNRIVGGDLNTRFHLRFGHPFDSRRWQFNLSISSMQIVIWLKDLLEIEPNSIQELDIFDLNNFDHFIETMRENYGTDNDVRELLENPILENLIDIQN